MTLKGTSPACVRNPSVVVKTEPNLGWREQVVIDKQPIEFPGRVQNVFAEYAAREKSVQDARLNNPEEPALYLGQQIEQKEQETIELNAKIRTVGRSSGSARQELNISRPWAKRGYSSSRSN